MNCRKKRFLLMNYMRSRNINSDIQINVIKFLEYFNFKEIEKKQHSQVEEILKNLSPDLRQQIYYDFYGSILEKFQIFKENFSHQFITSLALMMKEVKLAPGDTMVVSNQDDNDQLIYIKEGKISVSIDLGTEKKKIQDIQVPFTRSFRTAAALLTVGHRLHPTHVQHIGILVCVCVGGDKRCPACLALNW